jgi:hypothetical protein
MLQTFTNDAKQRSDANLPSSPHVAQINASHHPALHFAQHIAGLQKAIGNRAVLRGLSSRPPALQTKPTVNTPGDRYEQEADRVADQVMRMPEASPAAFSFQDSAGKVVQRKCTRCEEEEELHRKEAGSAPAIAAPIAPSMAPPIVHQVLNTSGKPLDTATRAFFEPRFGHDFGNVRVHTDSHAEESALNIRAQAYTAGQHIVFGRGAYSSTQRGRQLLAHELVHVIQQSGPASSPGAHTGDHVSPEGKPADPDVQRARDTDTPKGPSTAPRIAPSPTDRIARAPLDIEAISKDAKSWASVPLTSLPDWFLTRLLKYVSPHQQGEVAMAADYPSTFTLPADKTKPVSKRPKADKTPPLSNIPVTAHFFPSIWPTVSQRALVLGGFHGDEHPGWEVADELVRRLSVSSLNLAFHTIVIPRVNVGAIEDELAGVRMWRNRCNRQLVDLNRNFPTGNVPGDKGCANTDGAPIQPEVQGVMDVITKFKPDRILSTHAVSPGSLAGVFADPSKDAAAIELARGMASTLASKSDRPANKGLAPTTFDAVYPLDRGKTTPAAGTSLGAWAPTAVDPAHPIPVITMEAPEFSPLAAGPASEARSLNDFVRPVEAFLSDPTQLAVAADRLILNDIDAMPPADRLAFLIGTLRPNHPIYPRIAERMDAAIATLKAVGPPTPLTTKSELRLFGEISATGDTPQAQIVFDKFFLLKSWDTIPAKFRDKKGNPDRAKWLAASTRERLETILKFSSLPGTSRHHWNTEVDFNSVKVTDWQPGGAGKPDGPLFKLGQWLQANAPQVGFIQAYTPGRSGGYNEEPWHYSYAPLSVGLRQRYGNQANLQTDVIDQIDKEFQKRAPAAHQTVPADFKTELQNINISDLVNNVGPGL